jgi:transcriptional regulator with XRE-family HTH domain
MAPETVEFIGLQKVSGWNASEVARRLRTSRATVSRYLSGKLPVPRNMIDLLKFLIADANPEALAAREELRETNAEEWERKTIEDLRWLHKDDRAQVIAVIKAMIQNMPKRGQIKYDSKGKTISSAEETLALGEVNQVVAEMKADEDARAAGEPSVPKGRPSAAAASESKAKKNPANGGPQKNPRT